MKNLKLSNVALYIHLNNDLSDNPARGCAVTLGGGGHALLRLDGVLVLGAKLGRNVVSGIRIRHPGNITVG